MAGNAVRIRNLNSWAHRDPTPWNLTWGRKRERKRQHPWRDRNLVASTDKKNTDRNQGFSHSRVTANSIFLLHSRLSRPNAPREWCNVEAPQLFVSGGWVSKPGQASADPSPRGWLAGGNLGSAFRCRGLGGRCFEEKRVRFCCFPVICCKYIKKVRQVVLCHPLRACSASRRIPKLLLLDRAVGDSPNQPKYN